MMCRLFNYIQPASRLSPGCDYSLFKVRLTSVFLNFIQEKLLRVRKDVIFKVLSWSNA